MKICPSLKINLKDGKTCTLNVCILNLVDYKTNSGCMKVLAGIFLGVFNFGPCPNGNKVTFFPILKKKSQSFFFLKIFYSVTSHHTSYMVTIYYHFSLFFLQLYGNIVCVIANLFFYHNCAF